MSPKVRRRAVLGLAGVWFACEEPRPAPHRAPELRLELIGRVDEDGRLHLSVVAPGGLSTAVPVDRDGVAGAGRDDSVELVTRAIAFDLDCGRPDTICADVELGSFFAGPLADTCARITEMSPAVGFEPVDASAPSLCPTSAYGNFDYGLVPGRGARVVRWTFRRAAGQSFTFRGDVRARPLPGYEACDPRLPVPITRAAFGFADVPAVPGALAGLEVEVGITSGTPSKYDLSVGHLGGRVRLQNDDPVDPGCPPGLSVRYDDGASAPAGTCAAEAPGIRGPQRPLEPLAGLAGAPLAGTYGLEVASVGAGPGTLDRFCVRARGNLPPAVGELGGDDTVRVLVGSGGFESGFRVGDDDPDQSLGVRLLPTCPAAPGPDVTGDPSCFGQPSASFAAAAGGGAARPLEEGVPAALEFAPPADLDADASTHCVCVEVDDGVETRVRMGRVIGRRARGEPCTASSVCVSEADRAADPALDLAMTLAGQTAAPFCAFGGGSVCCESACDGPCRACDRPGSSGSCVAVAPGTEDPACGGYRCGTGACRPTCQRDSHCATGFRCDEPSGTCVPSAGLGAACGADLECASGFCAIEGGVGVCCDERCGSDCDTCQGATPGECKPLPAGTEAPSCGLYTCDGSGRCGALCTDDADCATQAWCDADALRCHPRRFELEVCERNRMCETGHCEPCGLLPCFDFLGQPATALCQRACTEVYDECAPGGACTPIGTTTWTCNCGAGYASSPGLQPTCANFNACTSAGGHAACVTSEPGNGCTDEAPPSLGYRCTCAASGYILGPGGTSCVPL